MRTSAKGLAFIRAKESLARIGYLDGQGVPTAGWGHTGPDVQVGVVYTLEVCEAWFRRDIAEAEAEVRRLVDAPLTQGMFDALVSFEFNCGGLEFMVHGRPQASKLLRALRERRWNDAGEELVTWNNDGGLPSRGLLLRRAEELVIFAGERFPE
jgi:lysozyme